MARSATSNRLIQRNIPYTLLFDGINDYGSTASINFQTCTSFTASGWFRLHAGATTHVILESSINYNNNNAFILYIVSGILFFGVRDQTNGLASICQTAALSFEKWYHFVITWDSSLGSNQTKIYLNGSSAVAAYGTNQQCVTGIASNPIYVGSRATSSLFINADIVISYFIANKAFSAQEASDAYYLNKRAAGGTLIFEYATSEGSGTTIADSSGNGYTLTINGPVWLTVTPMKARSAVSSRSAVSNRVNSVFSPTEISNCTLWLNAGVGVALNGTNVSAWVDQSGNRIYFTQTTAAQQPLYTGAATIGGKPTLDFDGTNDVLTSISVLGSIISTTAYTAYIVAVADVIDTNDAIAYQNDAIITDNGGYFATHLKSTPTVVAYNWDGNADSVESSISLSTPFVLEQIHTGGNLYVGVNGSSSGNSVASGATASMSGGLQIGQSYTGAHYFDGRLAEIIIYNRLLTPTEATTVRSYLGIRYGITVT